MHEPEILRRGRRWMALRTNKNSFFTHLLVIFVWSCLLSYSAHGRPSYCMKPPETGGDGCTDNLLKYFYLPSENTCKIFNWGGCTINRNVFDDNATCMNVCSRNVTEDSIEDVSYEQYDLAKFAKENEPREEDDGGGTAESEPPAPKIHLTLGPDRDATVFTFTTPSSYIRIGSDEELTRYQIRNRRSISLEFRTRQPHAILAYHGIKNRPQEINKYELYVMLDQGQLKIKHLFGDYSTTVVVGKGLNRDRWHEVQVTIDPGERKIMASVDSGRDYAAQVLDGLREHYLYGADNVELESVLFIGGLTPIDGLDISYLAKTFIGCVRNVTLETSPLKTAPLEPLYPLVASHHQGVQENCVSKCWEPTVKCSRDSKCINYYDHVECDCFKARFKGEKCKEPMIPEITLFGYSYITFAVFEWMDRVHSDDNRISMRFKTQLDDSILFYASGETPKHNHVALSIVNGSVYVDIDFGNGGEERITKLLQGKVTDSRMHVLTILHQGRNLTIQLDTSVQHYVLQGPNYHLHINPDVYIGGGGPILKNRKAAGLMSSNNFVGCLQEIYFNTKAILYELQQNNLQAHHHGLTPPAFGQCSDQMTVPITIPFAESGFKISNPNVEELELKFVFRSYEMFGTLAYSDVRTLKGEGFWELKFGVDEIIFEVQPDKRIANISQPKNLTVKYSKEKGMWHNVELSYKNGEVKLKTGGISKTEVFLDLHQLSPYISMGTSAYKPASGFKGCMRKIEIGQKRIDSRKIVGSDDQIGDIALDNCQFIDPCHRPNVCEHDGKCNVENDKVTCSCTTGYTGQRCHFATFKRTCEELALLGYTESGVYKIDIDGNGPYRPSHVKCKFENDPSGETKTIVEHNLANETDVWSPNDGDKADFKLELTYREFSSEMLLSLISQSVQCSQHIKYDCYKARLGLFQYTWFKPADPKENKVVSIGDASRGSCPCSLSGTCVKGHHCNCDSVGDKWLSDEGYFTSPERLGITEMSFVVPKNLPPDAASRITLGPLECVEANTQRYVVTFKTFGSYLEAPGWKSGDLAFSFRTTRSSAILLFQPLLHEKLSAFSVFLTNDYELTFQYVLSGHTPQEVTVRSEQRLSNGEWQQVWIDFDLHEVRFQINRHREMINLPDGQQFGPFEGTMYIAGAPENYLEKSEVKEGLIGCFRGLVMNGHVLDLYSYMKFHKADIIKNCTPSCDPNPCENQAYCQEDWGSYVCQCKNPFAHSGKHCETDINVDGLTFLSQSSYIKRQSLDSQPDPVKNILISNIYLNIRTYDSEALVLYANDNINNFVQIHVEHETNVVFTWNEHNVIHRITVNQKRLNHGIPVQIAVVRNETHTVLHVNDHVESQSVGIALLETYSEMPWTNPELEIFTPPRPFAPISPYYQVLLGGFDNYALKPAGNVSYFPGMLGCLNGLKIGNDHINISGMANNNDVLEGCKMVCDATPCKHGGICLEDFTKRTHSCDCNFTSYYGESCEDEKGATLHGETSMRRKFITPVEDINEIEAKFGFTTVQSGNDTLLITIQIPGLSYSLVLSLNSKGKLILIETINSEVKGATIKQNFADGNRHSVYFKRTPEETIYIVDQEEFHIAPFAAEFTFISETSREKTNHIGQMFVGGVDDSVPKLRNYQRFKGCFSNIYVKVNNVEEIRPIDEYMGFVKKAADLVLDVDKVEGIKLNCEPMHKFLPMSRDSHPTEMPDWARGFPRKNTITIRKNGTPNKAGISFDTLALIVAIFFGTMLLSVAVYVYKVNKRYRLRKLYEDDEDEPYFTHRGQPAHYYSPTSTELKYVAYRKNNPDTVGLLNNAVTTSHNGSTPKNNEKNALSGQEPKLLEEEQEEEDEDIEEVDEEEEEEEDDDDTTSQNNTGSNKGSTSSISDNQAVDDKEEEEENEEESDPDVAINTFPPIEEVPDEETPKINVEPNPSDLNHLNLETPASPRPSGAISPVFVSENARTFERSPIAIIGGNRYQQMKRASKDSILSLD